MKKRIAMLLACCLLLTMLAPWALAAETEEATEAAKEEQDPNATSGTCGDGLTWVLEGNTLTVSGSGEMDDGAPWEAHKNKIEKLVLTGGVKKIGAKSFYEYDRLESIDFGDALVEIGRKAFYGCPDLTVLHLPATFRIFGEECFRACDNLREVYCDGGMPRFNTSCLYNGNYISVFYPTNNPWPQEAVSVLVSNFGGRLGVMMGNYSATAMAEEEAEAKVQETKPEETEAPTEVPTEAPAEAATEPETKPEVILITTPATEEATEPVTEAVTEPETEPEPETTEETEPALPLEKVGGDGWIGIVLIAAVITFLLAGTMIFRAGRNKGGRYGG